jgi:ClpP class serine protease
LQIALSSRHACVVSARIHKIEANPYQPLPEAVHDQMQRELEVVRFLFAETVAAGRGDRLTHAAAIATEAAVFRGADAIAAGLADELADPVTAFHSFPHPKKWRQTNARPDGTAQHGRCPKI